MLYDVGDWLCRLNRVVEASGNVRGCCWVRGSESFGSVGLRVRRLFSCLIFFPDPSRASDLCCFFSAAPRVIVGVASGTFPAHCCPPLDTFSSSSTTDTAVPGLGEVLHINCVPCMLHALHM